MYHHHQLHMLKNLAQRDALAIMFTGSILGTVVESYLYSSLFWAVWSLKLSSVDRIIGLVSGRMLPNTETLLEMQQVHYHGKIN